MFLFKIKECLTPEEQAREAELADEIREMAGYEFEIHQEEKDRFDKAKAELFALQDEAERRYTSGKTAETVLADIQETLDKVTKADFQEYWKANGLHKITPAVQLRAGKEPEITTTTKRDKKTACFSFLFLAVYDLINVLVRIDPQRMDEAIALVNEKFNKWYPAKVKRESPLAPGNFAPMLNGPIIMGLVSISTSRDKPEQLKRTGDPVIQQGDVSVYFHNQNKLRRSAIKLFNACRMYFTRQASYGTKPTEKQNIVSIPLEEYMELCKKPLTKTAMDNMRKKVKADLEAIGNLAVEGVEKRGNKIINFSKSRIISRWGITNGQIWVEFVPALTEYLTNAYVSQFYKPLLAIDERNPNSFDLGIKLAEHASIDKNIMRETAHIISVKSLLEACKDIPSHEEVMQSNRDIENRIIKPFETALDNVPGLKWEYCQAKGEPLTAEQAQLKDYKTFIGLYISFELEGEPDQTERIERKKKEMEKRKKKAEKRAEKLKEQQAKKDG